MQKSQKHQNRIATLHDEKRQVIDFSNWRPEIPSVGIFDEPTRCHRINKEWAKIVFGFLDWLTETTPWKDAQSEDYVAIEAILNFMVGEDCTPPIFPESGCIAYPPYYSFISYEPMNPFTDLTEVPSGYLFSPFAIAGLNYSTLLNEAGDVVVQGASIPLFASWFDIIAGFLPVIKVSISGIGTAELHFVNQPLGGRVGITIDRPLNLIDMFIDGIIDTGAIFIDLNQDVLSFPGESVAEIVKEVHFDTDTNHEIYITFVPVLDVTDPPFLFFGGGFRSVHLCGLTPVAQGENIVNDVRINGCDLEKLINGVWVNAGNILACITGVTDPMQTIIANNGIDILNLKIEDTNLQAQITSNDNDITAIQSINTTQSNDIIALYDENDVQDTDITNLQNQANNLQAQITGNDSDITALQFTDSNHNTRITALENAPSGGGGSGQIIQARIETILFDYTFSTLLTNIDFAIPAGFQSLRIEMLVGSDAGNPIYLMYFNNDLTDTNYRWRDISGSTASSPRIALGTSLAGTSIGSYAQITSHISNLDKAVRRTVHTVYGRRSTDADLINNNQVFMHWESSDVINNINIKSNVGNFAIGSNIKIWGIKETDILVPDSFLSNPLVTFDDGGDPYTIVSLGAVAAGGNPDNALVDFNFVNNDLMVIDIDLGETKLIIVPTIDYWTSNIANTKVFIQYDGGTIYELNTNAANAWTEKIHNVQVQAQTIRIGLSFFGAVSEARIDNISIPTTDI